MASKRTSIKTSKSGRKYRRAKTKTGWVEVSAHKRHRPRKKGAPRRAARVTSGGMLASINPVTYPKRKRARKARKGGKRRSR